VVRSPPNLSDLIIDCAAEFLPHALQLLPGLRAILAFECQDIDDAKQAEENDKTKEKLAHVNLSPQPRANGAPMLQRLSKGPAFASPGAPPLRTV
jgi:hypothetical protein